MNPVVHEALTEVVHQSHPEVAANLTPNQWQALIQAIEAIIPIVINIFHPAPGSIK